MIAASETLCGYVAVVGRPNVGKSTLVNALVGDKVSIVTAKPQTTRHRILGVRTEGNKQTVFVDTPGLHRLQRNAMNRLLNRTALVALGDADLVLFVSEADRWRDEDRDVLGHLSKVDVPVIAVLNKIDNLERRELLLRRMAAMKERREFAEIVPVSARHGDNLERLATAIGRYLPKSPMLFPMEQTSDRDMRFRASEIIREKLMNQLHDELPYGLTVVIEDYRDDEKRIEVDALILVERESQKGIVVGSGGERLKQVGRASRLELKKLHKRPVHLNLWVKVRDNWSDNEAELSRLGFDPS